MGKTFFSVITAALMTFAGKLLAALGIGFVAYEGFDYVQSQFTGYLLNNLNNFPAAALQLFYMAGGGVVLNWFFGSFAFLTSIKTVSKLTATFRK